jgi:hypothetical protein
MLLFIVFGAADFGNGLLQLREGRIRLVQIVCEKRQGNRWRAMRHSEEAELCPVGKTFRDQSFQRSGGRGTAVTFGSKHERFASAGAEASTF